METAVAIGLGLLDVIAPFEHLDIVLTDQEIGNGIDILDVIADHSDTGDIRQILHG